MDFGDELLEDIVGCGLFAEEDVGVCLRRFAQGFWWSLMVILGLEAWTFQSVDELCRLVCSDWSLVAFECGCALIECKLLCRDLHKWERNWFL